MNDLIRKRRNRQRTISSDRKVLVGNNPRPSHEEAADLYAPQQEKKPSPNFVTNFLIPAWNIAFGHDELRERYLNLKPKR